MSSIDSVANESSSDYPTQLASVFRLLRTGKHLCVDDGFDFRDLQQHHDRYEAIFTALGYRLVRHPQNFFYFSGGNQLNSKGVQSVTLFLLVLFQHLDDHKFDGSERSWERELTNRRFKIEELPHFSTAALRSLMLSLDVTAENLREKVLRVMSRLGVIEYAGNDAFEFRSPVYRFIDLCIEFSEREEPSESVIESSPEADTDFEEVWEDVEDDEDDSEDSDSSEDRAE